MLIRNIWALGSNFPSHQKEMKEIKERNQSAGLSSNLQSDQLVSDHPTIFLKAGSSATVNSTEIEIPHWAREVHYEVELALKISNYLHVVEGAVALDLTERQLQTQAKLKGAPWTLAKSFYNSCAVSSFFSIRKWEELADVRIRLWVNDELRQEGRTSEMIYSPEITLRYVKKYFPLCAGDLILMGTPAGIGPLKDQDVVKAEIEGFITHIWKVKLEPQPIENNEELTPLSSPYWRVEL